MSKRYRTCPGCNQRKGHGAFKILRSQTNAETKVYAKVQFCADCQIARAAKRDADPVAARRHEMSPYSHRDHLLRVLGFSSYAAYLASELWSRIRLRVLKASNYRCRKCGGRATQVHHQLYGMKQLKGQSLKGMKAVCDDCHGKIEFDGSRKVGPNEASRRFYA